MVKVKRKVDGVSLGYVSTQGVNSGLFKHAPIDTVVRFDIEVENGATSASDINVNMIVRILLD